MHLECQPGVNETIIKGPLAKKVLATDHFWRKLPFLRKGDLVVDNKDVEKYPVSNWQ